MYPKKGKKSGGGGLKRCGEAGEKTPLVDKKKKGCASWKKGFAKKKKGREGDQGIETVLREGGGGGPGEEREVTKRGRCNCMEVFGWNERVIRGSAGRSRGMMYIYGETDFRGVTKPLRGRGRSTSLTLDLEAYGTRGKKKRGMARCTRQGRGRKSRPMGGGLHPSGTNGNAFFRSKGKGKNMESSP